MRGYLQFSSWISITIVKICFSRIIIHKTHKNTFELVGTVDSANCTDFNLPKFKVRSVVHVILVLSLDWSCTEMKSETVGCACARSCEG